VVAVVEVEVRAGRRGERERGGAWNRKLRQTCKYAPELPGAELPEVFRRPGDDVREELDLDAPGGRAADRDVCGGGRRAVSGGGGGGGRRQAAERTRQRVGGVYRGSPMKTTGLLGFCGRRCHCSPAAAISARGGCSPGLAPA
jgi:hypothetical protein